MPKTRQDSSDEDAGLFKRWQRAADALPGARFLRRQAEAAEERALRLLRQKLNGISDSGQDASDLQTTPGDSTRPNPAVRLQALIDRSLNLNPEQAEQLLYSQILDQLVPDEARILAALSDGGHIAICHVDATSRLGTHSERMLSYASRVGNEAGVILNDVVPYYLSHLVSLGLLETGPEDKTITSKYEMLETNSQVRKLSERIENDLGMKPRLVRHTARLSELGARLWQAGQPRP